MAADRFLLVSRSKIPWHAMTNNGCHHLPCSAGWYPVRQTIVWIPSVKHAPATTSVRWCANTYMRPNPEESTMATASFLYCKPLLHNGIAKRVAIMTSPEGKDWYVLNLAKKRVLSGNCF